MSNLIPFFAAAMAALMASIIIITILSSLFSKSLKDRYELIITALGEFDRLLSENAYINQRRVDKWNNKWKDADIIGKKSFRFLLQSLQMKKDRQRLIRLISDSEEEIWEHNYEFIKKELEECRALFDSIESYPLTVKQQTAIIKDEDNNLVIAGAGSGKTSTIVGKAVYLIKRRNVKPEEILLLAFTKKASAEMAERLKLKHGLSLDVKTFHKFGLDILSSVEGEKPSVSSLAEDPESLRSFICGTINELSLEPSYLKLFVKYFLYLLHPANNSKNKQSIREFIQNSKNYRTLQGEKVKSNEELCIANFLYENRISYKYEERYSSRTASINYRQYQPDFYLPDYEIYIEHFALIDRQNNVPDFFSSTGGMTPKDSYNASIRWKRSLHRTNRTKLVETYSYERAEGTLLKNLKKNLISYGVSFDRPRSREEILATIKQNEQEYFSSFVKLMQSFLNLFKSNNHDIESLYKKAGKQNSQERTGAFLELFKPVYLRYQDRLQKDNSIDFSDMLVKAKGYIESSRYKSPYKYILIDEFQDMSIGRYLLILALIEQNPDQRLFCVGDDWQSIYRFTGSDISVITHFKSFFGSNTATTFLDTTFRFNDRISEISGRFIQKNPIQIKKNLSTVKSINASPVEIFLTSGRADLGQKIYSVLDLLPETESSVFILGRYNFDKPDGLNAFKKKYPHLNITFSTVHSAKGLEADYVILINVNSGKHGFPTEITDDPILDLLLNNPESYENAEERRLFYVALTRTRNKLFIISDMASVSKFVLELIDDFSLEPNNSGFQLCPQCRCGFLIRKVNANNRRFMACNQYPLCSYTRNI